MINHQFERNARRSRNKARFFTLAFHLCLLGGFFMTSEADWESYVPDVVQEWVGMDTEEEAVANLPEDKKEIIRP